MAASGGNKLPHYEPIQKFVVRQFIVAVPGCTGEQARSFEARG